MARELNEQPLLIRPRRATTESYRWRLILIGVLVAAKFARYLNEFPKDQLAQPSEKLTTKAMQELVDGDLNYKLLRRRRSEA